MIYLFSKTVFDCRQATFLSVKKDEGTITPFERAKVWYHMLYCEPCRRFARQWDFLKQAKRPTSFALQPPFTLSAEAREKILRRLGEKEA